MHLRKAPYITPSGPARNGNGTFTTPNDVRRHLTLQNARRIAAAWGGKVRSK